MFGEKVVDEIAHNFEKEVWCHDNETHMHFLLKMNPYVGRIIPIP